METSQDLIATDGVGAQIGGMLGHGQQIGFNFQHVADEPDGIQGAHAEVVEGQQHQVAEVVARQLAAAGKAVLEQLATDAGGGHQLVEAVAQIPPGDALLAFAQASGGAAIIRGGDDARQPGSQERQGREHPAHTVPAADGDNPVEVIDIFLPHAVIPWEASEHHSSLHGQVIV